MTEDGASGDDSLRGRSGSNSGLNSAGRKRQKIPLPRIEINQSQQPLPIPIANEQPLTERTTIKLNNQEVIVDIVDLETISRLGQGQYGAVEKVRHKNTNCLFALKRVRHTFDTKENERHIREINVSQRAAACPYTVYFYGALFREGDLMILMELMDISLDKLYKTAYAPEVKKPITPQVLKHLSYSVLKALDYMKSINIIHRDVKPSNMLTNRAGQFKMCDFGISGQLVNSFARTEIGSKQYLAPERIDIKRDGQKGYTSVSDVWSFGVSLVELANGKYPYEAWKTPFQQINDIIRGPAPALNDDDERFTPSFRDFVCNCLEKDPSRRFRFNQLLSHDFLADIEESSVLLLQEGTKAYVSDILDIIDEATASRS